MGPNIEQIMLLLQRRYNALREISRLTEELQEAISCSDQVSASLLMECLKTVCCELPELSVT